MKSTQTKEQHFHFIGIGGIGMSGLAIILNKKGYSISGSDPIKNQSIKNLEKLGINIFKEQNKSNIEKINTYKDKEIIIVISSAIPDNNEELKEAYSKQLKIIHRSEILSLIINEYKKSILIAGSHGKTTTSTLITTLLSQTNRDPSSVIGGIVPDYKSNSCVGKSDYFIAEADESDGSIINYTCELGVITNIDFDHTDYYNNIDMLIDLFVKFSNNCKTVLANYDCVNLNKYLSKETIWWSTSKFNNVNFAAIPILTNGSKTIANYYENEILIDQIIINIPGLHNLNNTLGAIAACRIAGIGFNEIKNNLHKLKPPERRFEFKGLWNKRLIVEDYAHHPNEVKETISMARLIINSEESILPLEASRLIIVFQPHRFSRTRDFLHDFAKQLGNADILILSPIYSAGEKDVFNINSDSLKSEIRKYFPKLSVTTCKDILEIENELEKSTRKNDLILIMGAGDITKLTRKLIKVNNQSINT